MTSDNSKIKNWKRLYKLAIEFEKLAPWEWMFDTDIFGVKDIETGETAYCSVMGNNGEFYALGVYPGAEGFKTFDDVARGLVPNDCVQRQKCLMMAYDKRDYVKKEDMDIIKETDVRFSNRNFWPLFNMYNPYYFPQSITDKDVRFLIVVIEQAMKIVSEFKNKKEELNVYIPEKILVRVPERKQDDIFWHYEYLAPEKYIEKFLSLNEADEILAYKIKKEIKINQEMRWEVDFSVVPKPIKDGDDDSIPYYPSFLLVVDCISGMVMKSDLLKPDSTRVEKIRKSLLETIIKHKIMPNELIIRNPELTRIMKSITDVLGINIKMKDDLDMLDEAMDSFIDNYLK